MKLKKTLSGVLAVTTLLLGSLSTFGSASAYSVETNDTPIASGGAAPETSGDAAAYGLCDNINDGIILHAWCWSFNTIKNNMADIAAAGYTAVQTSPASECYDKYPNLKLMGTDTKDGTDGCWWWQYQPTALTVGNYQLGTEADYQAMCAEADKYGIKIITDIVANHTTSHHKDNDSGVEDSTKDYDADAYATAVGGFGNLYHETDKYNRRAREDNPIRFEFINYRCGGLPDINTENTAYQSYLLTYLNKLISLGCDGFRFDTAKQIGVRSWEGTYTDPVIDKYNGGNGGSVTYDLTYNFWPVVTGKANVAGTSNRLNKPDDFYFYGEILGNDEKSDIINAYADYIDVTASAYGDNLRTYVQDKDLSAIAVSNWNHKLTSDHLVTWVESHDSYCNDHDSAGLTDWQLRMAWAIVAARDGGTPLFFNRPAGSNGASGNYWGNNVLGAKGNDQFKASEVTAVNKFHNAMVGEPETLRNIDGNNQILQIDRGRNGTCIINLGNSVDINTETTMADGTYTDTVSGRTFDVTNGMISGTLGKETIATIYNPTMMRLSAISEDRVFTGSSIDVALNISNAQSTGSYTLTVDGTTSSEQSFSDGTILTIGSDINVSGGSKDIVLTLKATDNNSNVITKEYIYTKKNLSKDPVYVYFDNSTANKLNLKAYIYNDSGAYSAWSGESMTYDPDSRYYRLQMPTDYINGYVIFNGTSYQYPASEYPGLKLHGVSMLYNPSDNSWTEYYVTEDENDIPDSDSDLSTYRYTYFFNSLAWTGTATAELSDDSGNTRTISLKNSDDLHCYYVKYPVEDGYTKITFNVGSNSTAQQIISPGMVFVPTAASTGTWILPSSIAERTIYFSSTDTSWTSGITVNLKNGSRKNSGSMTKTLHSYTENGTKKYGADIYDYCYTYYYPMTNTNDKDYATVQFVKDSSTSTGDITIPADKDKIYVYSRGTGSGTTYSGASTVLDTNPVSVDIIYTGNKVANSKGSATYSLDTQQTINTSVDITNGNIPKALSDASTSLSMTSVFDDFTFYGSQFQYVSKIASLTDDRIGDGTLPYCAYVNPETLSKQSDAFSGVFGNSDNYISTLNSAQNNWVKYIDTQGDEISLDQIHSDFANLARIEVYAFSKPKPYNVTFHYPTNANSTLVGFANNSLYTNTANTVTYRCRYNELIEDATSAIQNNMVIPTDKIFDGWYMLNDAENITSYLKVSSEQNFKYRITDQNIDLYAVYRTSSTVPESTATALASSVDKFQDSTGVKYRYNTILNINDYKTTDGTVTDVAIIYAYGNSATMAAAKTKITNDFINGTVSGTTTTDGDVKYKLYKYTTGSSGTVELTNKNRLQFVLTLKDTQVGKSGTYSNVLAFVAYKCYNGTWKVSDNCVTYLNGVAAPTMITNN